MEMNKNLASDLAPDGVRVILAIIETPMYDAARATPKLIGLVMYFASHLSSYVTDVLVAGAGGFLAA